MNDKKARRIASSILKVGQTKIWISPEHGEGIAQAMTKEDVRSLIKQGTIKKRNDALQSRGRARVLLAKKRKGRKSGRGKRTGPKSARKRARKSWISNVRAQRRVLREMKKSGVKFKKPARQIYLMVKGNYFKGKKYLNTMVEGASK
ncbi:MAG TPA: 50S ribosomal protein L19e [archaeon]|nr:50S ribosomal protein L19e [archaeon]